MGQTPPLKVAYTSSFVCNSCMYKRIRLVDLFVHICRYTRFPLSSAMNRHRQGLVCTGRDICSVMFCGCFFMLVPIMRSKLTDVGMMHIQHVQTYVEAQLV